MLNGQASKYRISKTTENTVRKAAKELNFSPNSLARSLRLQKTHTIGLIIPDISNPFFASLARHVEREARNSGYSILLCDSDEDTKIELSSVDLLRGRKVDGMIIAPVGDAWKHLEDLYNSGMPIVLVDRYFPDSSLPYVTSNNFQGALEGVSYIINKGHRVISCIQGNKNSLTNTERVRGFKAAHKQHNLPLNKQLIVGNSFDEKNGYSSTKKLLKGKLKPSAIFTVGNLIAMGALQAAKELGVCVPEGLSILSFDEQPYMAFLSPPITTIGQNISHMAQIAVQSLFRQIESDKTVIDNQVMLPTRLIKRSSVHTI